MNKVLMQGNLAKDVEVRYTKNNTEVTTFTVAATTKGVKQDGTTYESTTFMNCVAWGNVGYPLRDAKKGDPVFVMGRLGNRSYETQDGQKRYITEITAEFVARGERPTQSSNFDEFGHSEVPF